MTVSELIEKLKEYREDMMVCVNGKTYNDVILSVLYEDVYTDGEVKEKPYLNIW